MANKVALEVEKPVLPMLSHEEMTEFLRELSTGERVVSINNRTLVFKLPTLGDTNSAKRVYNQLYTMLIQQGIQTRVVARRQLADELRKINVDYEEYQARNLEIQKKLVDRLQASMDERKALDIYQNVNELLRAVDQNLNSLTMEELNFLHTATDVQAMEVSIMGSCAEVQAETQANLFLMSQVTRDTHGNQVWASLDDLEREKDLKFVTTVLEEFDRFRNGFPSLYALGLPNLGDIPNESPSL